tara:strand:+ start:200 stop:451 length:252 start_codon:yes stop_codon:yes gene_type:complete
MDPKSLKKALDGVNVILGKTKPTKEWELFRASILIGYKFEQGLNLINQLKVAYEKEDLNQFIFSSINKCNNPKKYSNSRTFYN